MAYCIFCLRRIDLTQGNEESYLEEEIAEIDREIQDQVGERLICGDCWDKVRAVSQEDGSCKYVISSDDVVLEPNGAYKGNKIIAVERVNVE